MNPQSTTTTKLPLDFYAVFDASPNPYMLLNRELRFVAANRAYLRVTASRLEDLLGRPVMEAFPHDPNDPDNVNARQLRHSFEQVLETGLPDALALIPYRVPAEVDGQRVMTERFWSATHTPILDEQGKTAFILQHTVDVTELQELKQALQGAEFPGAPQTQAGVLTRARQVQEANWSLETEMNELRHLLNQAPSFMCFLRGPKHVYEMANDSYFQIVGNRDILGKSIRDALPELEGQGIYELLDRVYKSGEAFVGRSVSVFLRRHRDAEPEEAFLDFVYQPITTPSGQVLGIFVQGHEVTEQKLLEDARAEALRQEQAARHALQQRVEFEKQLIGIVSHDLRNPIAAILLSTQSLLRREFSDARLVKSLTRIQTSADRAARMVRDLLDFTQARLGSGFKLETRPTSLRDVVSSVVDELQVTAEDHEILFEAPEDVRGVWDPDRLAQVATNLISNAIKYGQPDTPVRVRVTSTPKGAELMVQNAGDPISPAQLSHIFEPLHRGVEGIDKSTRSIGLGLYIVDQVVRSHGGTVEVKSTLKEGTSFTVRLPNTAFET